MKDHQDFSSSHQVNVDMAEQQSTVHIYLSDWRKQLDLRRPSTAAEIPKSPVNVCFRLRCRVDRMLNARHLKLLHHICCMLMAEPC